MTSEIRLSFCTHLQIAKATELFVECLSAECASYTLESGKKTVQKLHLDKAIDAVDCLAFLEGAIDD